MIKSIFVRLCQLHLRFSLYPKLGSFGVGSIINRPLDIGNPENIFIGKNVSIQYKVWLSAKPQTGYPSAELIIKNGCRIGNFNHIYATRSIVIEEDVLTADKVYISDNLHSYELIDAPIWKQPIKQIQTVIIGEGSWIGENVCIIGASIGKHTVVGANSVVLKNIPDYSVAVGNPARIVKRYNFETKQWKKTNPDGSFIKE